MKPTEFFRQYDLHDSIIEDMAYIPQEMKVVIGLGWCRWRQSFYKSTEPATERRALVFLDVRYFHTEPQSFPMNSNEILAVTLLPLENTVNIVHTLGSDVGIIVLKTDTIVWENSPSQTL